MNTQDAVELIDKAIAPENLTDIQEQVFRLAWDGMGYTEIANITNYDSEHIKRVGANLWQKLSKALGIKISKSNIRGALQRYAQNLPVTTLPPPIHSDRPININFLNLKGIVHVPFYFGNAKEISTLKDWILGDRCQLVSILGMGGVGKTSLAAKLTLEIQENFEYVIWYSLRNAPPIANAMTSFLQFFFHHQALDPPDSIHSQISRLINYLHSFRCLLILDNFGSIFKHGELAGTYREGYETYSDLLHRIAEEQHQSCVVLTSRDQPKEVAPSETERTSVRSLYLSGLATNEALELLKSNGLNGSEESQKRLVEIYRDNPLALKIIANCIHELFAGHIEEFLEQSTFVLIGIWSILDRQFNRLAEVEKLVMYWLAIHREPTSLSALHNGIASNLSKRVLLEALESLLRRSLIEKKISGFAEQSLKMEYVCDYLTDKTTSINERLVWSI